MSASSRPLVVRCPTCNGEVPWLPEQAFRPFCSERCRLADFGEWVMEEKRIPGDSVVDGDGVF